MSVSGMMREEERVCEVCVWGVIEVMVVWYDFLRFGLRATARIVSDDGNVEAVCVNVFCCVFIDVDVVMYGLICVNVCVILSDGMKVIDSMKREENEARAVVRACALSKYREKEEIVIVGCFMIGVLIEEEYLEFIVFIVDVMVLVVNF